MKKEKHSVTKKENNSFTFNNNNFSFNNAEEIEEANPFEGYPSYHVWDETKNIEENMRLSFESWLKLLKHSDQFPPKITGDNEMFSWHYNLTIIFESYDQSAEFFKQYMPELGIYISEISAYEIAKTFNIDLETGKPVQHYKKIESQELKKLKFDNNFNFQQSTLQLPSQKIEKEISETLKNIRSEEKKLANYLTWVAQGNYYNIIAFKTEQEKNNFLKALGLQAEFDGKYIWGPDFAKALGLEVIPCDFKNKPLYTGREKRLEELILDN